MSSPEYKAIDNCSEKLEIAFKGADRDVVHHLKREGFINDTARQQVLNPKSMLSDIEKAGILVEGIKNAILLDESKFHSLVAYLRTTGKFYSAIVTILIGELDELIKAQEVHECSGNGDEAANHISHTGQGQDVADTGGNEPYSTDCKPVKLDESPLCDNSTRALLKIDDDDHKVSQTGKDAHLAIIDYGFYKKSKALFGGDRITFDDGIAPSNLGVLARKDLVTAMTKLDHGTVVASIATGKSIPNCIIKERGEMIRYPGGVSSQATVKCFSLFNEKTSILEKLQTIAKTKTDDNKLPFITQTKADEEKLPFYDVVSMSIVINEKNDQLDNAIEELLHQDTIVLAGCGNEGNKEEIGYPACLDGVVSVGSLTSGGKTSDFTWDEEPYADIYVFGEVFVPYGEDQECNTSALACFQGTSMAAPAAAGLACLAIQYINKYCETLDIAKNPSLLRKKRKEVIMNVFQRCKGKPEMYSVRSAKNDFLCHIEKETKTVMQ